MWHRITSSNEETTCPNIEKPTRTLAYYIQGGLGIILLLSNIFSLFGAGSSLIIGIILILTSSLWIMTPRNLLKKLTEPIRLYSFIALMVLLFLFYITSQNYFIGCFTIACSIWYFLSFFNKGQDICKNIFVVFLKKIQILKLRIYYKNFIYFINLFFKWCFLIFFFEILN